jgi:hypothetical protein
LAYAADGTLIVSGDFEGVRRPAGPDIQANRIAAWNPDAGWQLLGEGVDDDANALALHGNDLYVGGRFNTAGGRASAHIARWSVDVSLVSREKPLSKAFRGIELSELYPNPSKSGSAFTVSVDAAQHIEVDVYDALGRRVHRVFEGVLPADRPAPFDVGDPTWPAGLYFVRVLGEGFAVSRSLVWVK